MVLRRKKLILNNLFPGKNISLITLILICIINLSCNKEVNNVDKSEPLASDINTYKFTGDFDGNGFTDLAFWNSKDGAIWFGFYDGNAINWLKVYENYGWEAIPRDPNT